MSTTRKILFAILLIFGLGSAILAPQIVSDPTSGFGIWSLIPPILAILLAFLTRQVILSLFLGVFSGVLMIYGGNVFTAFLRTLDQYLLGSLADSWNAAIIFFTLSIGGMAGIIAKSGGTKAVAQWLAKKAKTPRAAQLSTFFAGVFIFFDDYANTLIVGPTMRPMTDEMKISREKLAYIVDSTAAPIVGLACISTWVGYEIGIMSGTFGELGVETNFFLLFIKTIPFTFYNIFALFLVFYIAVFKRDFGPMLKAERRARLEGKVLADDAAPMSNLETQSEEINEGVQPRISTALIPIFTLIITAFVGLWYNGYTYVAEGGVKWYQISECFGAADPSIALIWAAILASIVAGAVALINKTMTLNETFGSWIEGCKSLFITAVILILAWSIGTVVSEIGTADFLVAFVGNAIPAFLLPIIVFLISCLVAFATGTSWGTMAIVIPLAVPLAAHYISGDPASSALVLATLSSVLSGSIFGDHCSPISDTTIMSSMASGADHMDHVKTQIPYALTGAGFTILGYLIIGVVQNWIGVALALLVGIIGLAFFVKMFGKTIDGKPTIRKSKGVKA